MIPANKSPYGKNVNKWSAITDRLIALHPITNEELVTTVLTSWASIFNSNIGQFFIGKDIFPTPQIMCFFLHELVAHNLGLLHPDVYRVGTKKHEKDIHHIIDSDLSIEIKASSNPNYIFANRSYAQPQSASVTKNKDGYYIAINFEKLTRGGKQPEILKIRFGYLEHSDWTAQSAATGQQARLSPRAYAHKLKLLYSK